MRHIRTLRPDVIAGFLCGGEGGGQHHQASARLTLEAFRAAADPAKYPEQIQGRPAAVAGEAVFCTDTTGFAPADRRRRTPDLLTRGRRPAFDPVLGRTYSELGLEAR